MSEQPKPLSAEEVQRGLEEHYNCTTNEFGVVVDYEQEAIRLMCANVFRLFATLDAERARADAAEAARDRWMAHTDIADHKGMEWKDRHDAAQKSCAVWRECAGHLALVLRTLPDDPINYKEVRKALAEFDRLASEATKGVEF